MVPHPFTRVKRVVALVVSKWWRTKPKWPSLQTIWFLCFEVFLNKYIAFYTPVVSARLVPDWHLIDCSLQHYVHMRLWAIWSLDRVLEFTGFLFRSKHCPSYSGSSDECWESKINYAATNFEVPHLRSSYLINRYLTSTFDKELLIDLRINSSCP
jgi:hypothetical protein